MPLTPSSINTLPATIKSDGTEACSTSKVIPHVPRPYTKIDNSRPEPDNDTQKVIK